MNKVLAKLNEPEYDVLMIGADLLEDDGNIRFAEAFRWIAKNGYKPVFERQRVKYRWLTCSFEKIVYDNPKYWELECLRLLCNGRYAKKLDAYIALARAYIYLKGTEDYRKAFQILQRGRDDKSLEQHLMGL